MDKISWFCFKVAIGISVVVVVLALMSVAILH